MTFWTLMVYKLKATFFLSFLKCTVCCFFFWCGSLFFNLPHLLYTQIFGQNARIYRLYIIIILQNSSFTQEFTGNLIIFPGPWVFFSSVTKPEKHFFLRVHKTFIKLLIRRTLDMNVLCTIFLSGVTTMHLFRLKNRF